jgi:hypothetical protein
MTDGTIEFERGKRKWWTVRFKNDTTAPKFEEAMLQLVPPRSGQFIGESVYSDPVVWSVTDTYIRSVESLAHKFFKKVIVNGKEK